MSSKPPLYIGLMSGTSLDGVDAVLVDFGAGSAKSLQVIAHAFEPFPAALRAELMALNQAGSNELERGALASNALARCYHASIERLLHEAATPADSVVAVGAHGQTVRHRPGEFDGTGFTIQLNNAALLAELCGIDVVADFRSRDVAAGGQGAPLVPAFHRAVFAVAGQPLGVLNLGGIANLTLLHADGRTGGFDCGPANVLMDHWAERHLGRPYDVDGAFAASGQPDPDLLRAMLAEPYFAKPPPKSTGRDLFTTAWLDAAMAATPNGAALAAQDVQATLSELTAHSAAQALQRHLPEARTLLVCGGGARNGHVMRRLGALLPGVHVIATDERGLPATQVEATAFAWLAKAFFERTPGGLPLVTGARGPRVLGALYPA